MSDGRDTSRNAGPRPGDDRVASVTGIGVSIGIVAHQIGIHPRTLRDYERRGLVEPNRTPGGARRYDDRLIDRLRRIQVLTGSGMNLQGVQMVLELEQAIDRMHAHMDQLEAALREVGVVPPQRPRSDASERSPAPSDAPSGPVRQSYSLEIIHVPRQRRGPRWHNTTT